MAPLGAFSTIESETRNQLAAQDNTRTFDRALWLMALFTVTELCVPSCTRSVNAR
jgi:hypothetical protein